MNHLKSGLKQIGRESLFIIGQSKADFGKNAIWESAIEINSIAKKLYEFLEKEEIKSSKKNSAN